MANETTVTSAGEFVLTETIERMVYEAAYNRSKLPQFVRKGDLRGRGTRTMEFPKSPLLSAVALTEGVDMANSAFNPTSVSITASEVGLMVTPTDVLVGSATLGLPYFVGELGKAIGAKKDVDIAAHGASATASVGTSGSDMTETNALEARYKINEGNGDGAMLFGALHPVQLFDFQKDIKDSGGAIWGATAGPNEELPFDQMYQYGVIWISTTAVPTANAGADRAGFVAPIGDSCGIALVEVRDVQVEAQRDASLRATELVGTDDYGTGIPNPAANGIIAIITDA